MNVVNPLDKTLILSLVGLQARYLTVHLEERVFELVLKA